MAPGMIGAENLILAEGTIVQENYSKEIPKSLETTEYQHIPSSRDQYKLQIVWKNVFVFIYLHLGFIYGLYLVFAVANWKTSLFALVVAVLSGLSITAGAHRLWCHRSYKATWQLRVLLCIFQTVAFQNHIYEWVRDHRVHHKFTETDADPHNAKRGFFFSHIGWLMVKKHPDVKEKGKLVDMSDLEKDPIVMFQKKYYAILMPLSCFIIPSIVPWYLWDEKGMVSWYVAGIMRFALSLNMTWLVNSAAHIWGNRPFEKNIGATDNWKVAFGALGEGWHNYHHVFPWDYKAAELGNYSFNWTTGLIDFFHNIGWAYDMKIVPREIVVKRAIRTGDGSHHSKHGHNEQFWGWGDQDMKEDDTEYAEILK